MSAAPVVSILLPVRDAERTLPACLESIRRQRGPSWQCVAVDDGSRDASVELLRQAARADPRFVLATQPASGIVAALQHGLALCTGRLVARMDADDLMRARRLQRQVAALDADPALAGVGCHVRLFPRTAALGGRRAYEAWLNSLRDASDVARDAFIECPLAHPSLMLRRELLQHHGYRDAGWPEDYDLVLRLLGAGLSLGVVPERLLCWRDAPSRLSRTSDTYALERFTACKAHFLARGLLAAGAGYVLWGYGDTGRNLCRALLAEGKQPRAIVELHPGRLGQRIQGAPVLAPDALGPLLAQERLPIVVSVARAGPRAQVRARLAALGLTELSDYVCAA